MNIIVNINPFNASNISVNTTVSTLRDYEFFSKTLLGHKIFSSMVSWDAKYFLKDL